VKQWDGRGVTARSAHSAERSCVAYCSEWKETSEVSWTSFKTCFLVVSAKVPTRKRAAKTSEVLFCRFRRKSGAELGPAFPPLAEETATRASGPTRESSRPRPWETLEADWQVPTGRARGSGPLPEGPRAQSAIQP